MLISSIFGIPSSIRTDHQRFSGAFPTFYVPTTAYHICIIFRRTILFCSVVSRLVSSRSIPIPSPIPPHTQTGIGWISTYTGQLDTAVTAFRGSSSLLEVQGSQLATGGLDDPGRVGGRVVSVLMN